MEPTAASDVIVGIESPAAEIQDFDRVVELYWPHVFRFVLASVRDRDAAQTLTQDCLWRAYQARGRFRGDSSVKTWLFSIAVNLVRDFYRNRRLQFWKRVQSSQLELSKTSDGLQDVSPEASAAAKERLNAVWHAAEGLPERQRTVFLLRFVEEMELLEIAAATGLKEGAVKVHLFRALRSIRKRVGSL
jgi:RNA polymerase sigma-70 factor (ECF subfamily)